MSASYILLVIVLGAIGLLVQNQLRAKFNKYGQIRMSAGLTGAEVAATMLRYYGISDVDIVQGQGYLTDHYNPQTKTVNLSPEVYNGRSVAAASIAAHECGHVVQHAEKYVMLQVRSAIVPVVRVAAVFQQWGFLLAMMFLGSFPQLLLIVILSMAVTTVFSLITLPVEFDASHRALAWLEKTGTVAGVEHDYAKDSLKWAALTYLVAAISAIAMLVYFILSYFGRQ